MNKFIIAIILVILMILFDKNLFYFNRDHFSSTNNLDKHNKNTVWVYNERKSGVIDLCIESIKTHLGKSCNIIVFNRDRIDEIIPEYVEVLAKCKSTYMFLNLLKYAVIYKYGGIWLPSETIVLKEFTIDEEPFMDQKLIFFSEKTLEHTPNFNKFSFKAIASKEKTTQVKVILDKIIEQLDTFNYSHNFNKELDNFFNEDSHIHYSPIALNYNSSFILTQSPNIKIDKKVALIFIDNSNNNAYYNFYLTKSREEITQTKLFLNTLFDFSNNNS